MGADTVEPDVRIISYVSEAIGRNVTAEQALYVVEKVAPVRGISARSLDVAIWRRGADAGLPTLEVATS